MNYAEMMRKKNNYSIFLIVGTVVLGLLLVGVVIYPLYKTAAVTTKEADQKTAELNGLKNKKKILDGLKSKEEELKKSADLVSSALPEGRDVGGLFIQVSGLVTDSGGKVRSVTGGNMVATEAQTVGTGFNGIQKYAYNVPVTFTNYLALKDFIKGSKTALRLLNIDDISITTTGTGSMDAAMNITTYARN